MVHCDLNCDMGEGMPNDAEIMPFISSANISCGAHAGNDATIRETIRLAMKHGIALGAHPSFPDRLNFGRKEVSCTASEVYQWVHEQVAHFIKILQMEEGILHHVKPHGALYNLAARDQEKAFALAKAVQDAAGAAILYGLSGSHLISEGKAAGLSTASEVFADRTYQDDGSLTPRSMPGALIENETKALDQVIEMIREKKVHTLSGKFVPIVADTVCLHGDGKQAAAFARKIHQSLQNQGIAIQTFRP